MIKVQPDKRQALGVKTQRTFSAFLSSINAFKAVSTVAIVLLQMSRVKQGWFLSMADCRVLWLISLDHEIIIHFSFQPAFSMALSNKNID